MATRSCIIVVMYIWGEPKQAWSTGPHASTNQLTDRVRPIHVMLIPSRAYPATPPCHAHMKSAVRSGYTYKTENANDWKVKSWDTRTTNCEAGARERPANLFILALPCQCHHASLGFTYISFSCLSLHTNPFSHFPTYACAHCILDKTYAHTMHTDVDGSHPLALHATYNTAQAHPQRWSSSV